MSDDVKPSRFSRQSPSLSVIATNTKKQLYQWGVGVGEPRPVFELKHCNVSAVSSSSRHFGVISGN